MQGNCQLYGSQIAYAGMTDPGRVRRCNEDNLLILAEAGVFAVADGLGGLDAGDVASSAALSYLKDCYTASGFTGGSPLPPVEEIIAIVNARTYRQRLDAGKNMATTLAMVQLCGKSAIIGHVGDSRVYHWRDNALNRVTCDHSLVNELYRKGALTASQADHSPQRHVITRAVGAEANVLPSVHECSLVAGDMLLLCTDGLTSMLTDEQIASCLQIGPQHVGGLVRHLVDSANGAGGNDNITVVLVEISS